MYSSKVGASRVLLVVLVAMNLSVIASTADDVTLDSIREIYIQKLKYLHSYEIRTIEDIIRVDGTISSPMISEYTTDGNRFRQRAYTSDADGVDWKLNWAWVTDGSMLRSYDSVKHTGGLRIASSVVAYLDKIHTPLAYIALLEAIDPTTTEIAASYNLDLSVLLGNPGMQLLDGASTLNGIECRLVEMRESSGRLRLRAWLAPEFEYALVQLDETSSLDGRVVRTTCDDFIECANGLFLPKQTLRSSIESNEVTPTEYLRIRLLSVEINPSLTDHDFTIDFPPDAKVIREPGVLAREITMGIAALAFVAALGAMLWRVIRK